LASATVGSLAVGTKLSRSKRALDLDAALGSLAVVSMSYA
jgi:hypothetical protein